jgi:endonuclease/exonuclease/phosphatase family metal-dependent hydrolase
MGAITVCSYNIKYTVRSSTAVDAVCRLIKNNPAVSVIGLQESGRSRHAELDKIDGWRLLAPMVADGSPNPTPDPLLVRRADWAVTGFGGHRLNDVTQMPPGAPYGNERARFCVWATLDSRDGQGQWTVGNVHLVPGNNYDARHKAVYRTQMANLMRWVKPRAAARMVLIGDFNTLYKDEKNAPLHHERFASVHQIEQEMSPATHGSSRDIDHVWFHRPDNEVAWAKVLQGYPSDHRPLVVKLRSK